MKIAPELPLDDQKAPVHIIGQRDLLDLWACSPAQLSDLTKRGIAVRLKFDSYDLRASTRAYIEHLRAAASGRGGEDQALTLAGQRARLSAAQALGQELKNKQLLGELVKAADVEREWRSVLADLRAEMLALPARIGSDLPHLPPDDVARIDRQIRDILTGLADERTESDAG